MDTQHTLDAICPACRATCGLAVPNSVPLAALCDAHREYAERRAADRVFRQESSYSWRRVNQDYPETAVVIRPDD